MTVERDPGMDEGSDQWTSPELDPSFGDQTEVGYADPSRTILQHPSFTPDDDENPGGPVEFLDAAAMHAQTLKAIAAGNAGIARIVAMMMGAGQEIITLIGGAPSSSQRIRFRVQYLIIARATAGAAVLGVGSGTFNFTAGAVPVRVDFPLVVERGVDLAYTGDGFMYLIGWPE